MEKINYGKFYTYSELESLLKKFASAYPDKMRLTSLAKTEESREVYLVEITRDVAKKETEKKAGYYIQASVHSSEPGGGTVSLHLISELLEKNPDILESVVFYIVPRVNPDGVEINLVKNGRTRSKNVDDARKLENVLVLKDMDGDGLILQMRKKNPLGDSKEVAPGVMVARAPGETEGEFYDLYAEGEILNYNGTPAEDAHRSLDYNRCYPVNWVPGANSTEYPLRSVELRAVAEFLVTHPNIFAGIDFHNGQNGVLRSPMCDDSMIPKGDLELIVSVGTVASEIIGFPLISEYKYGKHPIVRHGCSNDFAYNVLGISHYVIELGNGFNDAGMSTLEYLKYDNPDFFYKNIKEYSDREGYEVFYEFKPFKHPQLGEVEIGGLRAGSGYYQNPGVLAGIVPKATEFILKHASMKPELIIDNCEVINLGNDIYRIRAQVKNTGVFGTKVMSGVNSYQASYPVHIFLGDGVEILSRPNIYEKDKLDSMESMYVEWFIRSQGCSSVEICASHPKAYDAEVVLELESEGSY